MKLGTPSLWAVLLAAAFLTAPPAAIAAARATADTTPPSRPTDLISCPVPGSTSAYVSVCWTASTDDSGVTGYDIYRLEAGGFVRASSTTGTIGGFSGEPGRTYTLYVVAKDLSGNVSPPSSLITLPATTGMPPSPTPTPTPTPTGDVVPPSKPTGLRDACLADFPGVTFCWQPSTDNVAVTAYDVYRETTTGYVRAGTVPATSYLHFAESGLVTGQRYTYVVVARDAAGNLSAPSDPLSALAREGLPRPTPSPTPTGLSCAVTYLATTWNTGLNAWITVKNTGTTAIDGWTLTIDYPTPGVRLTYGWAADWTQAGLRISGVNKPWNRVIPAGTMIQAGFNASHNGSASAPTRFALNGTACSAS
jgi:Cellulose binding domain